MPASVSVWPGRVRSTGPGHRSDDLSVRSRGVHRCDQSGNQTATDGLSGRSGAARVARMISIFPEIDGFLRFGYEVREPSACQPAQFVGGDGPLLVHFVAQPGADPAEHLVELLLRAQAVQTDHEGVPEAALVRGVGGAQRGVRAGGGAVAQARGGLVGQGVGDLVAGQVVRRLVGRGEQGFEIGVRAVRDQPLRPAAAAAAGEQGGFGGAGGRGVEPVQTGCDRRSVLLLGYGRSTGQRELLEWDRREGRCGCAPTLSMVREGCPTDAAISPGRESLGTHCGSLVAHSASFAQ